MLQTTLSSVGIDVNDAGIIPYPAKAPAEAVARPGLPEAVHQNGDNAIGALSLT